MPRAYNESKPTRKPTAKVNAVRKCYEDGMLISHISRLHTVSRLTVRTWAEKFGWTRTKGRNGN